MILLFEGHRYPSTLVDKYLKGINLDGIRRGSRNGIEWKALTYVGYFFNPYLENPDIVYILPKVFVYKKKIDETGSDSYISEDDIYEDTVDSKSFLAFGEFLPEKLIDVNSQKDDTVFMYKFLKYKNFIHQLTIWVYRTVHRYYDRNPKSRACISSMSRNLYSDGKKKKSATWVDYILALIQFSDENKDFFTFVYKQSHSGYNKVNWKKTISSSQPFLKGKKPVYTNFVTKKKSINYDEELLVILFSALKDIKDKYDFSLYINENFNLMSSSEYRQFKKHGVRNMLELKYKYFSDKTIALWNMLYSYFKLDEEISSNKDSKDFLLVNSFHVVFEDMIDYLISDEPSEYPKELKEHYDGKQVDHIYRDKSLVYDNEIYYVGDSKYYTVDGELERKSVQKQYTYAKNIIQRNLDVIYGFDEKAQKAEKKQKEKKYFPYRDDLTEGYNISPNFFISGVVRRDEQTAFDYQNHHLEISKDKYETNRHFFDRLFDRDTLILQRYNINFLFVLAIYARNKQSSRDKFREVARRTFKNNLINYINRRYSFYRVDNLRTEQEIRDFIDINFRWVIGKVFSFENNFLLLAVRNHDIEESKLDMKEVGFDKDLTIKDNILTIKDREYNLVRCSLEYQGVKPYYADVSEELPKVSEVLPDSIKNEDADSYETEPSIQWPFISDINDEFKFVTHLPLYTIKGACGHFLYNDDISIKGWIDVSSLHKKWNQNHYIVEAKGDSMSPDIESGDYCIMEFNWAGTRDYKTVLAAIEDYDVDNGGKFTIKRYNSHVENRVKKISLSSRNKDYEHVHFDYEVNLDGDLFTSDERIAGVLIEVLRN